MGHEEDDVRRHDEEPLEDDGELVDHVGAVEHRPHRAVGGEDHQGHGRSRGAGDGHRGHPVLPGTGQDQVQREDGEDGGHDHQLGRQRQVVDFEGHV